MLGTSDERRLHTKLVLFRQLLNEKEAALADDYLSTFIVANKGNLEDAKVQLKATLAWREENDIDLVPVATRENGLPLICAIRGFNSIDDGNVQLHPNLSESSMRALRYFGGHSYHKTDKEGYPVIIDRLGYHRVRDIGNNLTVNELQNYEISLAEFLIRVLNPECSKTAGRYIHGQTMIFDCSNLNVWQVNQGAINHFSKVMELLQNYYPETLRHVFIVNAPYLFTTVWNIARIFINEQTLKKFHILGQDYQTVLLEYISAENLPKFLGGSCECKHISGGCVPSSNMGNIPKLPEDIDNERVETTYTSDVVRNWRK